MKSSFKVSGKPAFSAALLLLLLLLLLACGPASEPGSVESVDWRARVAELTEEAWQRQIDETLYLQIKFDRPITELPDLTPEHEAEAVAFARSFLARLDAVPVDELEHQDALTVAMLRWDAEARIAREPYYWLTFPYTPHAGSFAFIYAHQALSEQVLETAEQTANYLGLIDEYADQVDQIRRHLQGQIERDIYAPKAALPGVLGLFRAYRDGAADHLGVAVERLSALAEEDRRAFRLALELAIEERVVPAFDAFLAVLESAEYQDAAPATVGLAQYPDGEAFYRLLVRLYTTMEITPEELHELGKKKVAALAATRAEIRQELGFEGSQEDFEERLKRDPRFLAQSPADVEVRYLEYVARMEPLVPELFSLTPKAPYAVRRLARESEPGMAFGYYEPPTPNEPFGVYYYNGSHLDQRSLLTAGPLIYHELIPGHHFQVTLQNENESLPPYRRESYSATAFLEGWANYAAYLAAENGLLDAPYDRYAWAVSETFFAVRLVVDTGMNLFGWSLEEARAYMRQHLFESETQIFSESLRYSTDLPGQALAYQAGFEKLVELREDVKARVGEENFDIRAFHQAVLDSGSMPLTILEDHLEWTHSN